MTGRLEAMGCWVHDHYRWWALAWVALVVIVVVPPRLVTAVLWAGCLTEVAMLEVGLWADRRRSAKRRVVALDPKWWRTVDQLAAMVGCSAREMVEK